MKASETQLATPPMAGTPVSVIERQDHHVQLRLALGCIFLVAGACCFWSAARQDEYWQKGVSDWERDTDLRKHPVTKVATDNWIDQSIGTRLRDIIIFVFPLVLALIAILWLTLAVYP